MPLDADLAPILDLVNQAQATLPPFSEQHPSQVRAGYAAQTQMLPPGPELTTVKDLQVPGAQGKLAGRLYASTDRPASLPLVVWFHGGGFVIGDLESHDAVCRSIADRTGAAVLAVEYRLAPEDPFPAAVDDAMAVTEWAAGHHDRVVVAGDSAGGNLAAVVARRCRDAGGPDLAGQALVYPVCDWRFRHPSYQDNGKGYFLEIEQMDWFRDLWLPVEADRTHPDASPLVVDDLAGLAPAAVITCEYDVLRDEGDEYATRMADAGVDVAHLAYPGLIHGSLNMYAMVPAADAMLDDLCEWLRGRLID